MVLRQRLLLWRSRCDGLGNADFSWSLTWPQCNGFFGQSSPALGGLQLEATLADAAAAKALVTSERERSGVLEKARAAAVEVRGWLPCLPAAPLAGCSLSAAVEAWP